MEVVAILVLVSQYVTTSVFLLVLFHKAMQLIGYFLTRSLDAPCGTIPCEVPRIVVQVPIYNEAAVIRRSIDACCSLQWSTKKLSIHILDDSSDSTTDIALGAIRLWQLRGVDVQLIRRPTREGYKGGALQNDMDNHSEGTVEFFAIFDADFAPEPDFLLQTMPYFYDREGLLRRNIGFVQTRWDYLNQDLNILTKLQMVILGAHFFLEQPYRFRTGRIFNFNGTGGIWRRKAIEDAGGWQHDTVVEDSDLSYRAWLDAGYRFVYLRHVSCLNELPTTIPDYRSQQFRWTKGIAQVFRKHATRLFLSREVSLVQKLEFGYHCLSTVAALATVWLHLSYPLAVLIFVRVPWFWVALSSVCLAIFTVRFGVSQNLR